MMIPLQEACKQVVYLKFVLVKMDHGVRWIRDLTETLEI